MREVSQETLTFGSFQTTLHAKELFSSIFGKTKLSSQVLTSSKEMLIFLAVFMVNGT